MENKIQELEEKVSKLETKLNELTDKVERQKEIIDIIEREMQEHPSFFGI